MFAGIGLFFSAFMIFLTYLQGRYTSFSPSNSEEFSSASRSVKPGLIASGIVSAWTWAATLLQSSAVAYKYGISGPWWYGAGATIQVLLFAMVRVFFNVTSLISHLFHIARGQTQNERSACAHMAWNYWGSMGDCCSPGFHVLWVRPLSKPSFILIILLEWRLILSSHRCSSLEVQPPSPTWQECTQSRYDTRYVNIRSEKWHDHRPASWSPSA